MKPNSIFLRLIPWAYLLLTVLTVRIYMTSYIFFTGKTPLLLSYLLISFLVAIYPGIKTINAMGLNKAYRLFNIYLFYTIALIVYSYFANYLSTDSTNQYKLLYYYLAGISCLSVYFLSTPNYFTKATSLLYKGLPFLLIIFIPLTQEEFIGDMSGFLLMPTLLPILFWKDLSLKSKIIFTAIAIFVITSSFESNARSNMIKFSVAFFIGIFINRYYTLFSKYLVWIFFVAPFVLFYLGISGKFNIFQVTEEQQVYFQEELNENSLIDSRTTIYTEALVSAEQNDNVIWGRGIGRGYKSNVRWLQEKKLARTARNYYETEYSRERNSEVAIINIFLWGGIIYVLIYTVMIVSAVFLGLYKTSNRYVMSVAVFLSFYYIYDWVENFQGMVINYFSFWFMVAICLSPIFRNMTDKDFKRFIHKTF